MSPPRPCEHPPTRCGMRDTGCSPLLRVQVTAAGGDGEEAGGAGRGTVALQEAADIEAEVGGAGQVVGVSTDPADDLRGGEGRRDQSQRVRPNSTTDSGTAPTSHSTMPKEKMSTFSS